MRKTLILAAVGAATLAGAAHAQPAGYGRYAGGYPADRPVVQRFDAQIVQQQNRIEWLAQRRQISPSEYGALRNHSAELRRRLANFASDGFSRGERQDIADRIDNLQDRIRNERNDGRYGDR